MYTAEVGSTKWQLAFLQERVGAGARALGKHGGRHLQKCRGQAEGKDSSVDVHNSIILLLVYFFYFYDFEFLYIHNLRKQS